MTMCSGVLREARCSLGVDKSLIKAYVETHERHNCGDCSALFSGFLRVFSPFLTDGPAVYPERHRYVPEGASPCTRRGAAVFVQRRRHVPGEAGPNSLEPTPSVSTVAAYRRFYHRVLPDTLAARGPIFETRQGAKR